MVVAERKDFSIPTNSSREINESIALTPFYTPFSEGGLNYLRQIKIILNKSDCQAPNSRSRRASEGFNERIRILAILLPPQMLIDCHNNINLAYGNTQRKGFSPRHYLVLNLVIKN